VVLRPVLGALLPSANTEAGRADSAIITGIALLIATPTLIFFGWLSDKIGRKPIILAGFALAALTYYPLYTALGQAADRPTRITRWRS